MSPLIEVFVEYCVENICELRVFGLVWQDQLTISCSCLSFDGRYAFAEDCY